MKDLEAYCSYEISLLLKKKGFNEGCICYYDRDKYVRSNSWKTFNKKDVYNYDGYKIRPIYTVFLDEECVMPTHQTALAWLREEKNIVITIDYNDDEDCESNERWGFSLFNLAKKTKKIDFATYPTYEYAVEAALKYTLENLI